MYKRKMPGRENMTLVACEACRTRKSRCDGTTPVCGTCHAKSKICIYTSDPAVRRSAALKTAHEQLQTRYDNLRSLHTRLEEASKVEASALLERIRIEDEVPSISEEMSMCESSLDNANMLEKGISMVHDNPSPLKESSRVDDSVSQSTWSTDMPPNTNMHSVGGVLHPSARSSDSIGPSVCQWDSRGVRGYDTHVSTSHKVFLWPAVYRQFALGGAVTSPDLRSLAWIGSPWLMRKDVPGVGYLPCDENIPFSKLTTGYVLFPDLSVQHVRNYSTAYFNTFNRSFPLLDQDSFMDGVLTRRSQQGYNDDDPESVLVLSVCALGQLALEGVGAPSNRTFHGEFSGFRGGTKSRPPGLGLFNQARRRSGIVSTQCSLENVQIMLLQGTYFEACARHADFWSLVSAASMSCMFLIKSQAVHWSSRYGDLVKRAFWICVFHERSVNLEFCVADTGIESLADLVPLPHFSDTLDEKRMPNKPGAEETGGRARRKENDCAYHLSAMIALGHLIRRASDVVHDYEPVIHDATWRTKEPLACGSDAPGGKLLNFERSKAGFPIGVVQALADELHAWRQTLPPKLQWFDDRKFDFTEIDPSCEVTHISAFNIAKKAGPSELDHNSDITVAHLRTCYYQARFLIYRPFIYKALHQPELMTPSDRSHCAFAVEAACHWPMSLAPPKNKMHLVPHLFSWTQNFLAILLVLNFCSSGGPLHGICEENGVSEEYIRNTIASMKTWLEDVSQVDGIAYWGLKVFS